MSYCTVLRASSCYLCAALFKTSQHLTLLFYYPINLNSITLVTRFLYARPQGFLLVDSVAMSVNAPFSAKGKPVSIVFMGFWIYTIISNSFLDSNYNYCQNYQSAVYFARYCKYNYCQNFIS